MIFRTQRAVLLLTVMLSALPLASCIDAYADIVLGRDGSGTITVEYVLSGEFAALGRQDGNSGRPPVPAGPADFRRAAARITGLRYHSGSMRERDGDVVCRARLDFDSPASLLAFLDGSGASTYRQTAETHILSLALTEALDASPSQAQALPSSIQEDFAREAADGREVVIRFRFPSGGDLYLTDGEGRRVVAPPLWTVRASDGKAEFRAPLGDLITREGVLFLEAAWTGGSGR